MNNYFWPIYKNIEDEILLLSNSIVFDDKQLSTYSTKIYELIIRCSVEIESIAKKLYILNGGTENVYDEKGKKRDLYFDTDCIEKLQVDWGICDKKVYISSEWFYFTEFTGIKPLFNCNKRSKGKWKKAYQSIKHDRVNSIEKANIENLFLAVGALYILNLYYSDKKYTQKHSDIVKNDFDLRLNSNIFYVKYFDATKINMDRNKKISFDESEIEVKKECIYIKKHSDEWVKKMSDSFVNNNLSQMQSLINNDYDLELVLNKEQSIYNI